MADEKEERKDTRTLQSLWDANPSPYRLKTPPSPTPWDPSLWHIDAWEPSRFKLEGGALLPFFIALDELSVPLLTTHQVPGETESLSSAYPSVLAKDTPRHL